ncbi:MAG: hypothetical protein WCH99_14680 [Verrucomicrobiota bacterium]
MDLTQVSGIQSGTALVLAAKLGPDNRITGGKIMSSATRDLKSRATNELRLAAQDLHQAQNYLGDLYRRWKARLRIPKSITAMGLNPVRILWHLFKHRQLFDPAVFNQEEEKMQRKKSPGFTTAPQFSA